MFGRATIRLGIGPHSSIAFTLHHCDNVEVIVSHSTFTVNVCAVGLCVRD